ncbi:MAG: hypothetical protein JNN15_11020 [Blastocatellia bacterium]|nr:hypothetical protein [Blastocatellia bacterium]
MTFYTVKFCDQELIADNLRDFAKIAVFAKWYLRSRDLSSGLECSIQECIDRIKPAASYRALARVDRRVSLRL